MPVVLIDVAGIREDESLHPVEAIGIARAKKELERADLVLHLVDATTSTNATFELPEHVATLQVITKKDLLEITPDKVFCPPLEKGAGGFSPACYSANPPDPLFQREREILISAKTGEGIPELVSRMKELLAADLPDASELVLTRLRHIGLVKQSSESLTGAITSFSDGVSDECVAYELRDAGKSLDELLGKNLNEEVLDLIFSKFCIGK
jgi:tRNA modification GTPase